MSDFRFYFDGERWICHDCASVVYEHYFEKHDRWHDDLVEAFKARDQQIQWLVDFMRGKPPRAPYRRPQTPEERAHVDAILRELGLVKDGDSDH